VPLGLKLALKQWKIANSKEFKPNCSCQWLCVYGTPCCHTIKSIKDDPSDETYRGILKPELWVGQYHSSRIKKLLTLKPVEPPQVKDPHKVYGAERPKGSKNKTSSGKPRTRNQTLPRGTEPCNPLLFERTKTSHRIGQTPQIQPTGDGRVTKTQLLTATPQMTQDVGFAHKGYCHGTD
jgi:hypothetical protein